MNLAELGCQEQRRSEWMDDDNDCEASKRVSGPFSASVWSCRSPHGVAPVGSPLPLVVQAIFRVVWEDEQACPTAPQFWPSRDGLVVDWLDGDSSPRVAGRPAPGDGPAPADYAQWPRPDSSVQIALGCAVWAVPTTRLACQSDSHARA